MSDLKQKVLNSSLWSLTGSMAVKVVQPLTAMALSWFLLPSSYGTVMLASVIVMLAGTIAEMGRGEALIQQKTWRDDTAAGIFFLTLSTHAVMVLAVFFSAPLLARNLNEPALSGALYGLCALLLIKGAELVPRAILIHHMRFRELFWTSLSGALTNAFISILCAFYGLEIWALVAGMVGGEIIVCLGLWRRTRWRPTPSWHPFRIQERLHFGRYVCGEVLAAWVVSAADLIILAWYQPSSVLGLFRMGKFLGNGVSEAVSGALVSVALPASSSLQNSPKRVLLGLRKALRIVALVLMPVNAVLVVSANLLVSLSLGDEWQGVVSYVRVFALMGMLMGITSLLPPIYRGMGQSHLIFRFMLVRMIVTLPVYLYFARQGALEVAGAHLGLVLLFGPVNLTLCAHMLSTSLWSLLSELRAGMAGALLVAIGYLGFAQVGDVLNWEPLSTFLLALTGAAGTCLGGVWIGFRSHCLELIQTVSQLRPR